MALDIELSEHQGTLQVIRKEFPNSELIRIFGVDYEHISLEIGDLYLTHYGLRYFRNLLPGAWFEDKQYAKRGERLVGSNAAAYRVPTHTDDGDLDLVVKFSRVAQHVPIEIFDEVPIRPDPEAIYAARFNSPFEEFDLVTDLLMGTYGPRDPSVHTQHPLAIFSPSEKNKPWQKTLRKTEFYSQNVLMRRDQEGSSAAIELDELRNYTTIYEWVEGIDALAAYEMGLISDRPEAFFKRVHEELEINGFEVLDNKSNHYIVEPDAEGGVALQGGRIKYTLVDFELLSGTEKYRQIKARQTRQTYFQSLRKYKNKKRLPENLKRTRIFGIDYIYGTYPNGAKIWIVGDSPELFDFFSPERWRRTRRVQLNRAGTTFMTRTKDDIHLVYKISPVGQKTGMDPYFIHGRKINEYGYNSPFEEIAIAEELRKNGIRTVFPRVIYRTGSETIIAPYLQDNRRFERHRHIYAPDRERVLQEEHSYYLVWGRWRGIDPLEGYRRDGHWGLTDVRHAFENRILSGEAYRTLYDEVTRKLAEHGLPSFVTDDSQIVLKYVPNGKELQYTSEGHLDVAICINALIGQDVGLLSEEEYKDLLDRELTKIRAIGFDHLNWGGEHLLLSFHPFAVKDHDRFARHPSGDLIATLCSFTLIQPPEGFFQ